MNKSECFELGYLMRPHGLAGELGAVFDVDDPNKYEELGAVLVEVKGQLVPYEIEYLEFANKKIIVKFHEIDTVEQADPLKNSKLWLPLSQLPPLGEGQFYYHEIIGYQVQDAAEGLLGTVANVYDLPAQHTLVVKYQGHEVMVPIADHIVKKVDHAARTIFVQLPDGLLAVYTSPQKPDDQD
ncbi:MAG: ribosome maturation factor RimM [Bernardetiaceae bacterium]|jgi:16S rRNA processing protein RimM|nr:ribosome maturation factor RimM [Bernardetiaceae bacterium]